MVASAVRVPPMTIDAPVSVSRELGVAYIEINGRAPDLKTQVLQLGIGSAKQLRADLDRAIAGIEGGA